MSGKESTDIGVRQVANRSKSFEDVGVWQAAHSWVLAVYRLTSRFPESERFGLTSQLRRAAVSIPANFAEGFGKSTAADKLRFYNISQGSMEECRYYLVLARDLGYADTQSLCDELRKISRMLGAYMAAVRRNVAMKRQPAADNL